MTTSIAADHSQAVIEVNHLLEEARELRRVGRLLDACETLRRASAIMARFQADSASNSSARVGWEGQPVFALPGIA